ncbi:MAG: polysaccharide deacetylase family protein [Clostridia bacterium]|nr:polysaccharide deacetylase family protein [Clostridia bacterium]
MYLLFRLSLPRLLAVFSAVLLLCGAALRTAAVSPADTVTLPVIMYHGLHLDRAQQSQYVISPDRLEEDLRWLTEKGYTTVTVAQLIAYTEGEGNLPEKPVLLTFDDGYLNNHLYATPLLQAYNCRAVLSPICSETVRYSTLSDRTPAYAQVTWNDLSEMVDSGCWEIQNHSYAMHSLTGRRGSARIPGETLTAYTTVLTNDVSRAQMLFQQELGLSPTAFFYPFGAIGKGQLDILKSMGFRATFTCTARLNTLSRDPDCLYELGRFLRPPNSSAENFFTHTVKIS